MSESASPKRVSFDDRRSSVSDEDRNAVEVVFDDSNPYRRKSSLVSEDAVPPHLRRAPPPGRRRTECLVHQFLANQRKIKSHLHGGNEAEQDGDLEGHHGGTTQVHQPKVGFAACEAEDVSGEAGSDRPLDPKAGKAKDLGREDSDDGLQPYATVIRDSRVGSDGYELEGEEDYTPNDDNHVSPSTAANNTHSNTSTPGPGQLDEKQWRRSMVGTLSRTPSQLDRRSASVDAPNSRLLTKQQLSEMAWGVRELSRRLGSMRLRFRVKTIFLLTKIYDPTLITKTRELSRWLLDRHRDVRYTIYVDRELRDNKKFDAPGLIEELRRDYLSSAEPSELSEQEKAQAQEEADNLPKRLRYWDEAICRSRPHTFDFVITLGGDGTVLYASWLFQRIVPPVLSFALGSLGFLTKFDFEDYQKTLTGAFQDGVTVSLRLRFEATVMRSQERKVVEGGKGEEEETSPVRDLVEELIGEEKDDEHTHRPDGTYEVLNEVVVDRGPNPTMSNVDIFGDDEHFTSVSADGVCVSTPTGSTAYNLAAGGSLCHPENPVMLVAAICAHTLSFRPVILPDTIVLRIGVPYDARASSWASFDGRERVELRPGDYVTVSASRYPFACVQPSGRRSEDWINSISAKLAWNSRQRQKAYKEWK
ncbi:ATP-NAD kinase-like domain-containing protein [Dichotomopilus funicola]|uniref:ATP-NAD kinase-like domain-containing protein n=1 Tax=Dichotomopilus funicola TaxID=1934379 RepID=A0AAN6ZS71_9PEZI|nr:ATP-NAD kinase-like domain-containing protein [Dichotomopilus funicola]